MRTQVSKDRATSTAADLADWFDRIVGVWSSVYFDSTTSPAHRDAAVLEILSLNAKRLMEARLDVRGDLYGPLTLTLAAACRRLDIAPSARHWMAALHNVMQVRNRVHSAGGEQFALHVGTAAAVFKDLFCEALVHAGVTDRPTVLVEENRRASLGLAVNWGLRFLLAYAFEIEPTRRRDPETRDLHWVRSLVHAGQGAT